MNIKERTGHCRCLSLSDEAFRKLDVNIERYSTFYCTFRLDLGEIKYSLDISGIELHILRACVHLYVFTRYISSSGHD